MRLFFVAAFAALAVACSSETPSASATDAVAAVQPVSENARAAAVLIRADWCSSCKIIEPKLDQVKAGGAIDGLEHVTLDYTARDKAAFFAAADKAGVGEAVREQLGGDVTTGIILVVDMDDDQVIADLRKELSTAELKAAMVEAVANS